FPCWVSSSAFGQPSMLCGKTENWTRACALPTDFKVFFIGIRFALVNFLQNGNRYWHYGITHDARLAKSI
ncbi:MAG: hypothetical protein CTY34_13090, partial [Methylobacter sp.]